jgi:O-acetylhomoserine/O-acetylserine sulfhydrylase-like pyridoxal-dependent enzyme
MTTISPGVQEYVNRGVKATHDRAEATAEMRSKRFDTIAVHGLYGAREAMANQGSIIEPTYLTTSQHFDSSDHLEAALGYMIPAWGYSRIANPTTGYLEATLAMLEGYGFDGDVSAMVTSSGMSAVFMATQPFLSTEYGSDVNFASSVKVYGGTYQLFSERYARERSVDVRWIEDSMDISEWEASIDDNTRFLYTEMPSNPGCAITDLEELSRLAERYGLPLIVDSTLASPAIMRPLCFGADIVVHSLSKIIGASGMAIAGAVIARHGIRTRVGEPAMAEDFATWVKLWPARDFGPSLSPMSAMLLLSELRSLRQRADAMSDTALEVARYLESHQSVSAVTYPGLASAPHHDVATRLMQLVDSKEPRYGSLLSFEVASGDAATRNVFDRFQMIMRATDLGRVKTVAVIPAISTHQQQGPEARDVASIPGNLIRLSVGLEHPEDIINDLSHGLGS